MRPLPKVGDPFGRVLGPGRGLSSAAASQQELKEANDELAEALASLADAEAKQRELLQEVRELRVEVLGLTEERDSSRQMLKFARIDRRLAENDRDRARYAAMRSGQPDPCGHAGTEAAQQREWTPGRPYLADQHARHPKTGECYRACSTGAPVGEVPGTGRHWERCLEPDMCPDGPAVPDDNEQKLSGWALRETELFWGRDRTLRSPRELTDTELTGVIGFLRRNASDLCAQEWTAPTPMVPCPANAYPSAAAWMADMPLMRALLRERRRRRDASRRQRRGRGRGS
jgi:hypothetical protein